MSIIPVFIICCTDFKTVEFYQTQIMTVKILKVIYISLLYLMTITLNLFATVGTAFENRDGASRDPQRAESFPSNQNLMNLPRISAWHVTFRR